MIKVMLVALKALEYLDGVQHQPAATNLIFFINE